MQSNTTNQRASEYLQSRCSQKQPHYYISLDGGTCRIGDAWTLPRHLPSVVIIAIDVKHLVSLDTENTVYQINDKQLELPAVHKVREEQHTQTEHTPSTLRRGDG